MDNQKFLILIFSTLISVNSYAQSLGRSSATEYKELTQCFGRTLYTPFAGVARGRAYYDQNSVPLEYVTMSLFAQDLKFYSFYKGQLYITSSQSGLVTYPIDGFADPNRAWIKRGNQTQWRVTLNQEGKEVTTYTHLQASIKASEVTTLGFPKDIVSEPRQIASALEMMIHEIENRFLNITQSIEKYFSGRLPTSELPKALDEKRMKELKDGFCACERAQIDPLVLKTARDEIEAKGIQKIDESGQLEVIKSNELRCDFSST